MHDPWANLRIRTARPWPMQPLLDATSLTLSGFSHAHGVSYDTMRPAARDGLTDKQADHWAVKAGLHPACVWPDWTDGAEAAA